MPADSSGIPPPKNDGSIIHVENPIQSDYASRDRLLTAASSPGEGARKGRAQQQSKLESDRSANDFVPKRTGEHKRAFSMFFAQVQACVVDPPGDSIAVDEPKSFADPGIKPSTRAWLARLGYFAARPEPRNAQATLDLQRRCREASETPDFGPQAGRANA
jgi:hypothetical protein